ncbi:hypothetical protein EXU57_19465 [Segetibacter sp. 3557_3]|uniref:hypothetical protein n=1 Tax=Segetibacter sp. 3557_3 TaxID=2547429 RepID=UPI0010591679|nr:hypothetical protein [Segetibacter sp. 3557_3]TDH21380.1 hypothetical protein EXU57_19465 [Segetibacter sp. 3557_3]
MTAGATSAFNIYKANIMNNHAHGAKVICMSQVRPINQAVLKIMRKERPVKIRPLWLAQLVKSVRNYCYDLELF